MINHHTNDKSKKRPIQKRQIYKLMINKDKNHHINDNTYNDKSKLILRKNYSVMYQGHMPSISW